VVPQLSHKKRHNSQTRTEKKMVVSGEGGFEPARLYAESVSCKQVLTTFWSGLGIDGHTMVNILVNIFSLPHWHQKRSHRSEEFRWLFDRFQKRRPDRWKTLHGLFDAVVYELRSLIYAIEPPWWIRHLKINAMVTLTSNQILRVELSTLRLCATGDIKELRSPYA
jgi:hypothetical protein